jgi:hypothetical protein
MRRLTQTALVLSTLVLVPLVRAEDKKPPAEMPKPAQALTDAFKEATGTWTCKGKFQKMDGSGTIDGKSMMVLKSELGGFAYSGAVTVEKNAVLPKGMKEQLYFTYNAATNKLVEFYADSYGGFGHGTSDGETGDTVVWDEESVMMAKAAKTRTTVKRNGPKQLTLTFEMETDGKWATFGTNDCKKH